MICKENYVSSISHIADIFFKDSNGRNKKVIMIQLQVS